MIKVLIAILLLIILKYFDITSVDWVFIIIFIIIIGSFPIMNNETIVIDIGTLFRNDNNLNSKIQVLENRIKKLEEQFQELEERLEEIEDPS